MCNNRLFTFIKMDKGGRELEKITEVAKKYFLEQDNSCSEATLKAAAELFEIEIDDKLVKAIGSFSGGCGVGDLCGTAAGALAAIGLKYGTGCVHECEIQKNKMKDFMAEIGRAHV